MPKITDLASLRVHSNDLRKDIAEVLAKYGITGEPGNMRIGTGTLRFSIDAKVGTGEELEAVEADRWKNFAPLYNLNPEAFGKVYRLGGGRYRVVGLKTGGRSEKRVLLTRVSDGKTGFVARPDQLNDRFLEQEAK